MICPLVHCDGTPVDTPATAPPDFPARRIQVLRYPDRRLCLFALFRSESDDDAPEEADLGAAAYTVCTFSLAVVWHVVLFKERYESFGYFEG